MGNYWLVEKRVQKKQPDKFCEKMFRRLLRNYSHIQLKQNGKIAELKFNRPEVYNAIHGDMFDEIADALNKTAKNENISMMTLTGNGKFYSSGNDITNFLKIYGEENGVDHAVETLDQFVFAFIEFPKPLIALVNGPAIGIGVTTLGLCDLVWASSSSYFLCPFTKIAQAPEGCSSYTFPKIMGTSRANEMLLCNRKISAQEAKEFGLVSEVYQAENFDEIVQKRLSDALELGEESMRLSKSIIRPKEEIERLKEVALKENRILKQRWSSQECQDVVSTWMSKA